MRTLQEEKGGIHGQYPLDWGETTLGELGTFFKGKGITKRETSPTGLPCIRYGEIYTDHNYVIKNFVSYISADVAKNSTRIQRGDILFAVSGETAEEIGKSVVYLGDEEAYAGGDIVIFRPRNANSLFLSYVLNSTSLARQRARLGEGYSVVHIYSDELRTLRVPMPPVWEQQRIAEILYTWDEAIELKEEHIARKKDRKYGLMQSLLFGKIRWNEAEKGTKDSICQRLKMMQQRKIPAGYQKRKWMIIPDDWRFVKIGDIAEQVSISNEENYDYPVLSCTKYDGLVDSLNYFGRRVFSEDLSNYKVVRRNHFAYATNHIEEGSIGLQNRYDCGLVSPMYTVFKVNEKVADINYLYSLLKTENYRRVFEMMMSASVDRRGSLRWKDFSKIQIPLPSLEEQKKIAEVLTVADEEITLLEQELKQLYQQKNGLMQLLLTGKVRVQV
ncbi:restriction endonuclease subunit S [Alicyclobacillus tolerans]|uniref:Type I restriction enzyme, S subunit n=1 Tax=Alicyclobacillus tolerans TaxID=90970 RepID=A0A1M6LNP4_9BACL|nr:restriction endonuclease subunit S [Alicyclobacillus montanus]SHJ72702.1 type I restriction enzyme, S subunit [Alicyclobacillus montanus]